MSSFEMLGQCIGELYCTAAVLTDICLLQSIEERKGEQIVKVLLQKEYTLFFFFCIMKITKVRLQARIIYYKNSAVNS